MYANRALRSKEDGLMINSRGWQAQFEGSKWALQSHLRTAATCTEGRPSGDVIVSVRHLRAAQRSLERKPSLCAGTRPLAGLLCGPEG